MKKLISMRCVELLFLFPLLGWQSTAMSVPLAGTLTVFYHDYSGTIDPIDVNLGDGITANTGQITYKLDITNPALEVIKYDFDNMTVESHVDVLVDDNLATQQRLHLDYHARISVSPTDLPEGVVTEINIITGAVSGSGLFGPNQLFADWKYSNILLIIPIPQPVKPDKGGQTACADASSGWRSGQVVGSLTSPDGLTVTSFNTTGYGFTALDCTPIPEPPTLAMFLGGIGLMLAKQKTLKQPFKKS